MAKTQTKQSRLRNLFAWFRRHKVAAGFLLIALVISAYFAVSSVVWDLQVYFERNSYNKAAATMLKVSKSIPITGSPKVTYLKFCYHSNFGGVFGTDKSSCRTGLKVAYSNDNLQSAKVYLEKAKNLLSVQGLNLHKSSYQPSAHLIETYSFNYGVLKCYMDGFFYDQQTLATERDLLVSQYGSASLVDIECGGASKMDYFPAKY